MKIITKFVLFLLSIVVVAQANITQLASTYDPRSSEYGARYYDPRTSVWQSPDPILNEYMSGQTNGGVFNPRNLNLFTYTYNNPVNLVDPDGNEVIVFYYASDKTFEKAARNENKNHPKGVVFLGVSTETDFKTQWNSLAKSNQQVDGVRIYSHGSKDESSGSLHGELNFKGDNNNDGRLSRDEILDLPKLNYEDEASIDLYSCNSGTGPVPTAKSFSDSQEVTATGTPGYAYFSKEKNKYSKIDSKSESIFLKSFNRGLNNIVGNGEVLKQNTYSPNVIQNGEK